MYYKEEGFPGGSVVSKPPAIEETWVRSMGREDSLGKEMTSTPLSLLGKSHGQRSLAGYSPWGHKGVGHDFVTKQ